MRYPHTVTFEAPSSTRTPAGGVTLGWVPVDGLEDLPARCIPVPIGEGEVTGERMMLAEDRWTIVVQGDRAIERDMRAVSDHVAEALSVVQVQRPVLYGSSRTIATIVEAERISVALPVAGS